MSKKEAGEIKKLPTPAGCVITRICGCYMDSEKNEETELKGVFPSLQEGEALKYFTVSRNALSGTVGKDLINMGSPSHTEVEGGIQRFPLKLRGSQLKDDATLEEFCDKAITAYDYGENYYIILIHCVYDIPTKATDSTEIFDTSNYVCESIQCTTCPVKLSKAGLCYNSFVNTIENHDRDRLAEASVRGSLFPVFSDRNMDIHSLLYYTKNPEELPDTLINELLGCVVPMFAKSQKETFQAIVEEILGESRNFEIAKSIHKNLSGLVEETKGEPVPLTLDKYQVKEPLETNGVSLEKLEEFEQRYAEVEEGPGASFVAANVANARSSEIKTPDVNIKVSPDKTYLVENCMVDGWPCIVVATNEHAEINGITIHPVAALRAGDDEDESAQIPFQNVSGYIWTETGKAVKKR